MEARDCLLRVCVRGGCLHLDQCRCLLLLYCMELKQPFGCATVQGCAGLEAELGGVCKSSGKENLLLMFVIGWRHQTQRLQYS